MSLMISCLKATELIEKKNFSRLSVREKMKLAFHKSMCSACAAYEKQSQLLDKILNAKANPESGKDKDVVANSELKHRIISKLP
jgi:hypothetical protein